MRINKLTLGIVVGLLLCTLVLTEFPELINLVDNSSNDFSLVVFAKDVRTIVKIQMLLVPGAPVVADIQRRQAALCFSDCSLIQSFRTSDDVFHASCVLRI